MDIDPRLRPANDRGPVLTNPEGHHHHHRPLSYNQLGAPSGIAGSTGSGPDANNATATYAEQSPRSSTDHVQDSTPSSSGNNGLPNIGAYAFYLNEASLGLAERGNDEPQDPNDPLNDLKRPRACEACRQLKVRCESDNDHPNGSCRRCAKAGRTCVVTAPSRKRQKKTDSRVADLEKKIDALTASLQASRGADTNVSSDTATHRDQEPVAPRRWLGGGPPPARPYAASASPSLGAKRTHTGESKAGFPGTGYGTGIFAAFSTDTKPSQDQGENVISEPWPPLQKQSADPVMRMDSTNEFVDIIDRGIIDVETASKAFNRYVHDIAPTLPVVVFPAGTTMASIRQTKPTLFLAIMSISIGAFQPKSVMQLSNEFHRVLADKVIVKGEKSVELIEAVVVSCMWYAPPDQFEELKFFQFIHIAVVMALDIGMGRRTAKKGTQQLGLLKEIMGKKWMTLDPDAVETRRLWLGCYFLAVNAAVALRRTLLCRWNSYMDECIEILQHSPNSLPSDQLLIYWAKMSHIAEEVGFQFSMDDPISDVSLHDPKAQYALKGFEKQLDQWRAEIAPQQYSPLLRHAESVVSIYMHEIAMHIGHNIEDFHPPFTNVLQKEETPIDHATAAQVDALTACLTSIHSALDIMATLDHKVIVCLPTIFFARTAYAFVALLKLYSTVSQSNCLGQVFAPADLQVEQYLDKVISHLKASGLTPGGRTPGKFCMILSLLKNWFTNRKDGENPEKDSSVPLGEDEKRKRKVDSHAAKKDVQPSGSRPPSNSYPRPSTSIGVNASTGPDDPMGGMTSTDSKSYSQYSPVLPSGSSTASSFWPHHPSFGQQPPGYDTTTTTSSAMMPDMLTGAEPEYAGFIPELGMQMPFDPEGFFSIGGMLQDGFFGLPMDENSNFFVP